MPTPPVPIFSVTASKETGTCSAIRSGERRLPLISAIHGNRGECLRSFSGSIWMGLLILARFFVTINFHGLVSPETHTKERPSKFTIARGKGLRHREIFLPV